MRPAAQRLALVTFGTSPPAAPTVAARIRLCATMRDPAIANRHVALFGSAGIRPLLILEAQLHGEQTLVSVLSGSGNITVNGGLLQLSNEEIDSYLQSNSDSYSDEIFELNDEANLNVTDKDFAKKHGELPKIYGEMWRKWPRQSDGVVDQLQWIIDEIIDDPHCHNAIVTSWNPEYLYAMAMPGQAARYPICHNMYQINLCKGKLCLQLYQRSADIFLGVPFNIGSYALLTMIIAKITGYEPGEFIHTFGDVHIYEKHIESAKEQLSREPMPFPTVTISDEVTTLDSFRPEHVTLNNYESHPPIKAELAVVGGYNAKIHEKRAGT